MTPQDARARLEQALVEFAIHEPMADCLGDPELELIRAASAYLDATADGLYLTRDEVDRLRLWWLAMPRDECCTAADTALASKLGARGHGW